MPTTINPSLKALATLAELTGYMNHDVTTYSDTQKDALQRLINGVSEAIANECKVPLIKSARIEYYDGGHESIVLKAAPVDTAETFEVKEDGEELEPCVDGTDETAAGDEPDYYLDPEAGIITRGGTDGTWAEGKRIVKVTYTAGLGWQYTTVDEVETKRTTTSQTLTRVDIPDALREAALIILKAHTDLGPTNWGTQVLPQGGVLRPSAWPLAARLILSDYSMPRVG